MTRRVFRARRAVLALALGSALLAPAAAVPDEAQALPPRDKASVIQYLQSITGKNIVSGQHNKEPASAPAQYTQQVKDITGEFPGLWGGDLMFANRDVAKRQQVIDEAKSQWANGSLVALTWHACSPTGPTACEFEGGVKSSTTDAQFQQIVTKGTQLNNKWQQRMAKVVPYLRQLKDAGVPVLFRPFHEMNEDWNWWGGRPGADGGAKIYQQMKDYFDSQGLTNLIWVWNVQDNPEGGWADYYPGDSYVDVISLDVWYKAFPSSSDYEQMQAIAGSKPIAIAEMGKAPDDALLQSQTRWSYFMIWSEQLRGNNTTAEVQSTYSNGRVLNQGEITIR